MRRILKILIVVAVIIGIIYAAPTPIRTWMDTNLGPPLAKVFGGAYTAVTQSPFWRTVIIPFSPIIMFVLGLVAYHFAFRPVYTKVRTSFVRSAAKDSGMYPTMTEPVSQPTVVQPTPVATTQEPSPTPAPTPTPPKEESTT